MDLTPALFQTACSLMRRSQYFCMNRSKETLITFWTGFNLDRLVFAEWPFHYPFEIPTSVATLTPFLLLSDWDMFSFPSMQCALHQLGGHGVPDRPSGRRQGHIWDTGCRFSAHCHHRALQGVLAGHHADRQPEEVSLHGTCPLFNGALKCLTDASRDKHCVTSGDFTADGVRQHVLFSKGKSQHESLRTITSNK